MAWTQADIDALKAKIVKLEKSVEYRDRKVVKQDLDKQLMLLAEMERQVNGQTSTVAISRFRRS